MSISERQCANARAAIGHYLERLGVGADEFAANAQVDPLSFKRFCAGDDGAITADQQLRLGLLIVDLSQGEDLDHQDFRQRGFTDEDLPLTVFDVVADSNARYGGE
jgi:hypothetical protein